MAQTGQPPTMYQQQQPIVIQQANPAVQIQTVQTAPMVQGQMIQGQFIQGQVVQNPGNTVVIGSPQQPQIVYQRNSVIYGNYKNKMARGLGITQIVVGGLAIALQIASILTQAAGYFVAPGIWAGILIIIAGILAVVASSTKSQCSIIATMVMTIIAGFFSFAIVFTAMGGLIADTHELCGHGTRTWLDSSNYDTDSYRPNPFYEYDYVYDECNNEGKYAVNAVLMFFGLIAAIVCIWQSALCCASACCGRSTTSGTVLQGRHNPVVFSNTALTQPQLMTTSITTPQQAATPHAHAGVVAPPAYQPEAPPAPTKDDHLYTALERN